MSREVWEELFVLSIFPAMMIPYVLVIGLCWMALMALIKAVFAAGKAGGE